MPDGLAAATTTARFEGASSGSVLVDFVEVVVGRPPVRVAAMAGRRTAAPSSRAARPVLSTRVASATSLVRRTASRLLISIGTSTKSQSTTREIHSRDWGMLGMTPAPFPFRLGP